MKLYVQKLSLSEVPVYCRHFAGGTDKIGRGLAGLRLMDAVVLGLLIVGVLVLGRALPAWVFIWALAVVLGVFCKWIAWRDARSLGLPTPLGRTLGWFFLWPGMDGRAFFGRSADRGVHAPAGEWFSAFFKLAIGCVLIWVVGSRCFGGQPMAFGWCCMLGIILVLHFGVFHLLSLAWRAFGVDAAPIMYRPLAATSLAQLWSECWNTAFSIPARRMLLMPLARRIGINAAGFTVFAASGLMHELVISVPARGGYGLPTAYFLLQGAGVWFERTRAGRALGLGSGVRGWLFTFVLAAGPVYWLFHPPFVRNVILPMVNAIGAH